MDKKELSIEDKIAGWKKKYGNVYAYSVRDYSDAQKARKDAGESLEGEEPQGDEKRCYLHAPDRKSLSAAAVLGKNDPLKYNEILLNNCWIEGDTDIREDNSYFLGISGVLAEIIEVREGHLKKL